MANRAALCACVLTAAAVARAAEGDAGPPPRAEQAGYRILHVMSYHSQWRWTDGQLQGFKDAMAGVPAEYRVFEMDTKRNSSARAKEEAGRAARALIEQWKPDLVYTSDDDAAEYVARHYAHGGLPFVFSGVNGDPGALGIQGSSNVTGVLEHEHFVESVQLLRKIAPGVRRIAVVLDDAAMWDRVQKRMRAAARMLPDVELGPWDTIRTYDEYKRKVRAYQGVVDAIALVGVFNFKDGSGNNVPYQEVLRWTAENSRLPDLGFWIDRVHFGTTCAVTVSEREQGLAAGRIARAILTEGRSPSSFEMRPTVRGLPVVSLARIKALGLTPTTGVLLSSEVIQKFDWDRR
jgi:ABC-type uncharacterized transport system substrate-binding protein